MVCFVFGGLLGFLGAPIPPSPGPYFFAGLPPALLPHASGQNGVGGIVKVCEVGGIVRACKVRKRAADHQLGVGPSCIVGACTVGQKT